MPYRLRNDFFLFIGLVLSIRCGGRMIDESIVGSDAGGGSTTFSSTTGRGTTTGPTTAGPTTTGFSTTTTGDTTSTATTTSTSTGFGSGPTTTAVSSATTTSSTTTGFGGYTGGGSGGYGGASSGTGGFGGTPQILCTSAPIPDSNQQVNCKKSVGAPAWECACVQGVSVRYCTGKGPMPCGSANCCGFDTSATGCGATPVTLPPISGCVSLIRSGYLGCAHVDQINNPGYGPFTSCCPPSAPFSCPTGTPGSCFATAEQARANCKEYCVQCVPTMF